MLYVCVDLLIHLSLTVILIVFCFLFDLVTAVMI